MAVHIPYEAFIMLYDEEYHTITDWTKYNYIPTFPEDVEVEMNMVDLGSLTYTYDSSNQRFYVSIADMYNAGTRLLPIYIKGYDCKMNGETYDATWNMVVYAAGTTMYIHNHNFTDATAFKASLKGIPCYYQIA